MTLVVRIDTRERIGYLTDLKKALVGRRLAACRTGV